MVKSLLVAAALVASASAFAPAQTSRASTTLNEFCNGYPGGDSVEPMPVGKSENYDPMNLAEVRRLYLFCTGAVCRCLLASLVRISRIGAHRCVIPRANQITLLSSPSLNVS